MEEGHIPSGYRAYARRRLTVAQAADQLGVTVDAIRSRVKRGTIDYVREGGRVYIMLGADQDTTRHDQGNAQHTDQSPETGPDYRNELVEELRDRVRALEEANRENRRIIAMLASRVPELESPRDEPQAPESTGEGTERVETPADVGEAQEGVERRSWWRRLFGG